MEDLCDEQIEVSTEFKLGFSSSPFTSDSILGVIKQKSHLDDPTLEELQRIVVGPELQDGESSKCTLATLKDSIHGKDKRE